MDPITFTAILAALGVIAEGAGRAVGQNLATDAYEKLKTTLKRKFGDDSEVVKAVDTVEEDPKSDWRQGMLKEKLERAGADQDPEVRKAAQELLDQVTAHQYASGNYIAQADRGSSATVDVNRSGDNITVGDITRAQGIAIGRQANATVTGHNMPSDVKIDAGELRAALEGLYDSLGQTAELPRDKTRSAQTAAGNALDAVSEDEVKSETVVENVRKVGETIKQANVAVREGSALWQNVQELARLIGRLVGGASVVTAWFGI